MTTIISFARQDHFAIAADGRLLSGGCIEEERFQKVVIAEDGGACLAFSGAVATRGILDKVLRDTSRKPEDLALRLRKEMDAFGWAYETGGGARDYRFGVLGWSQGHGLFEIDATHGVTRIRPGRPVANGSGTETAVGVADAILSLAPSTSPADLVAAAVRATARRDTGTGRNVFVAEGTFATKLEPSGHTGGGIVTAGWVPRRSGELLANPGADYAMWVLGGL